jgi:hypothetical protein
MKRLVERLSVRLSSPFMQREKGRVRGVRDEVVCTLLIMHKEKRRMKGIKGEGYEEAGEEGYYN